MNAKLYISVEAVWRGSSLDTVSPVAALSLQADPEIAGLLTIGSPYQLTLATGHCMHIWCAKTATHRYVLDITSDNQPSIHIAADAPISSQIRFPDGKIYELSIRVKA